MTIPIDNVYATVAVLLLCGLFLGHLARRCHLPSITGNILAGIALGPILGVVATTAPTLEGQLEPITNFALSLIAVSIGSHLHFSAIHNAYKRLIVVALVGAIAVPIFVFGVMSWALKFSGYGGTNVAFWIALLSIATAPATVLHLVKEFQARGIFVKTLVGVVVLNNVANIFLFESARQWLFGSHTWWLAIELGGSLALGIGMAYLLALAWRRTFSRQRLVTLSFTSLIVAYGLALQFHLSPVLTTLTFGVALANLSERNRILEIFEDFEATIFAFFFTLVGTHVSFTHIGSVGLLAAIYLGARMVANLGTVFVSGQLTHMPKRVSKYLGLALTPQAGITVGLLLGLKGEAVAEYVTPIILLGVAASEILGPLILRFSLRKSGEEGQALPRLIDFLHEEYITLDVAARDREGVIRELVDFLFKTHPSLRKLNREALTQAILKREGEASTAVGQGIAIPHGIIPDGPKITGVMGIFREGLQWDDDEEVHMVVLIATPPEHREQHLGVLATIGKLFRQRGIYERELHLAQTAAEVYEAIVDEEFAGINQVLEPV